ncbi:MAG: AAA family ATPase, partial [Candidatus Auribacterota bacterium]|nr:AAA family ATPase [Candidatus Auribacterota bacterium]
GGTMTEQAATIDAPPGTATEEGSFDNIKGPEHIQSFYYRDDLDYLEDIRLLILEKDKAKPGMAGWHYQSPEIREIRQQIENRKKRARKKGVKLRIDRLGKRYNLNSLEKLIICAQAIRTITGDQHQFSDRKLLRSIAEDEIRGMIAGQRAINNLIENKILEESKRLLEELTLSPDIFQYLIEAKPLPDKINIKEPSKKLSGPDLIKKTLKRFPTPTDIYQKLDRYVIGQETANRTLAVGAFEHLIGALSEEKNRESIKKNILLIGPTGCGKTHLIKTLAHILGMPYAIGDTTTWTEEGYVGSNYDEVLWRLYLEADKDIEKAQTGIVFIDEIDKISSPRGTEDLSDRDVGGAGVQRALLKALDGDVISVASNGSHTYRSRSIKMDTSGILFILGGAFTGIKNIIEKRNQNKKLGFATPDSPDSSKQKQPGVIGDDLISYGLIREFVGRIPVISPIHPLTEIDLIKIMARGKHSLLKEINRSSQKYGIQFIFTRGALEAIAKDAIQKGTGARSLRGTINKLIEPYIYKHAKTGYNEATKIRINKKDVY